MNRKQIVERLVRIANRLDGARLHVEADALTDVAQRVAQSYLGGGFDSYYEPPNNDASDEHQDDIVRVDGVAKQIAALHPLMEAVYGDDGSVVDDEALQKLLSAVRQACSVFNASVEDEVAEAVLEYGDVSEKAMRSLIKEVLNNWYNENVYTEQDDREWDDDSY